MTTLEKLIEQDYTEATTLQSNRTIDANGVLTGVHFCGLESVNGYGYTEKALREACTDKMYDNVDIYMDHAEKGKKGPRSQVDKIGFAVKGSATFVEGKGAVGAIQFNVKHPHFEAIKWWVENAPKKFGMSHVVGGVFSESQNKIVQIKKVRSLDLVSDPATTQGMFLEGVISDAMQKDIEKNKLMSTYYKAQSLISDCLYPLRETLTDAEKVDRILPIVQDLVKELKTFNSSTTQESKEEQEETEMKTSAELREKHPDLYNLVVSEAKQEGAKTERAIIAKFEEAVKDIPADKRTKLFVKSVREAIEKGEDVAELISEHKELIKPVAAAAVETTVVAAESKGEEVIAKGTKKDKKEVVVEEGKKTTFTDEQILAAATGKR